jgi:hypothetical protein
MTQLTAMPLTRPRAAVPALAQRPLRAWWHVRWVWPVLPLLALLPLLPLLWVLAPVLARALARAPVLVPTGAAPLHAAGCVGVQSRTRGGWVNWAHMFSFITTASSRPPGAG